MVTRRAVIPTGRQVLGDLGTPPDCAPYYKQRGLPGSAPAGTIGATDVAPPDNRERFHSFNSIVAPAAGTTNAVITSFTCPIGHQAKVVGILVNYIGGAWVEGDPTLIYFSLRLNGAQFVRDYSQIPNQLGDLAAGPWPVPGAIKLAPNDLLEVLVTVPGGSTIATGGTNRVHGHLLGWYWPNQ